MLKRSLIKLSLITTSSLLLATSFAFASGLSAHLYKDANCGCCSQYAQILRKAGVNVTAHNVESLELTKEKFHIPKSLQSCHTTVMGGYVFEGHLPLEIVKKVLTEKEKFYGVALANMPMGSPGMGKKEYQTQPFMIYKFEKDGSKTLYSKFTY